MEATTRRLPPILQIEAKAKISALLSDLEMKAYLSNETSNYIYLPPQSPSPDNPLTIMPTASPGKPVDFSNHGKSIANENVTDHYTNDFEDILECDSAKKNYYSL